MDSSRNCRFASK